MNMYRWLLFAALFLLASCGSPDTNDVDWCYTYNFVTSQNEFSISAGSWVSGQGLITDDTFLLQFSYGYTRFVEPVWVIVTVARGIGVTGDIPATVAGEIFGVGGTFSAALPDGQNSAVISLPNPTIGLAGNAINVTVDAGNYLLVRSIEIRGNGANPFPVNECDKDPFAPTQPQNPTAVTPTPTLVPSATNTLPASPVPSETATATITLTPSVTNTPTITNTPGGWTCTFDFSAGQLGWTIVSPFGSHTGGEFVHADGITGSTAIRSAMITKSFASTTLTSIEINYDLTKGTYTQPVANLSAVIFSQSGIAASKLQNTDANGNNKTFGWTGSSTFTTISLQIVSSFDNIAPLDDYGGAAAINSVTVSGIGTNTVCDDPTPTPTATQTPNAGTQTATAQTATAAATLTPPVQTPSPGPGYVCTYSFALNGGGGFQSVEGSYSNGVGWLGAELGGTNSLEIERSVSSTTIDFVKLFWLVEITSATLTITEPYGSVSTINVTGGSRNQIMSGRKTNVTLLTFSGTGSAIPGKRLILAGAEVHGQGNRPEGAVCGSPTETPVLTRTPLATGTARPITRTPVSLATRIVTATPGGTPTGLASGAAVDAGQVGNNLQDVGNALGQQISGYINDANALLGGVFGDFNNAAPSPIPGLPLCLSNPTAHDWCAIIYIIEYTILADGTPGQLIVPILQIFVYIYLLIYFVRGMLWLTRRGEQYTDVS